MVEVAKWLADAQQVLLSIFGENKSDVDIQVDIHCT